MFMIRGKENYIHYLIYSSESTVMVFYIAPHLIKELTTQENKCRSEPKPMELTGLIISAPHPPSPGLGLPPQAGFYSPGVSHPPPSGVSLPGPRFLSRPGRGLPRQAVGPPLAEARISP